MVDGKLVRSIVVGLFVFLVLAGVLAAVVWKGWDYYRTPSILKDADGQEMHL